MFQLLEGTFRGHERHALVFGDRGCLLLEVLIADGSDVSLVLEPVVPGADASGGGIEFSCGFFDGPQDESAAIAEVGTGVQVEVQPPGLAHALPVFEQAEGEADEGGGHRVCAPGSGQWSGLGDQLVTWHQLGCCSVLLL